MSFSATVGARLGPETSRPTQRLRRVGQVVALTLADVCAFVCADVLFRWGRIVPALAFFPGSARSPNLFKIDVFLVLAILFIGARALYGDYRHRALFWDSARDTTRALVIASIPDLFFLAIGRNLYSPFAVIGSWLFLIFAVPVFRQVARNMMSRLGMWRIRTALVGDGSRIADVHNALAPSLSLGYDLRTIITSHLAEGVAPTLAHLEYIAVADSEETVRRMLQSGCEQAVVAVDDVQSPQFSEIIQLLLEADIKIAIVPSLRRLPLAGLNSSYFFGKDVLLLQVRNNLQQLPRRMLKRSFDILGALVFLVLFSPFFAAIAIAIKLNDGGPIFYAHKRIGRGRTPFACLKFRTMTTDADQYLQRWRDESPELYEEFLHTFKLRYDPRVTKPGKWLRRTSLDELPQLINVLRGDMSLVGPRPVVEKELDDYYGSAAQLYCRARPGMTGLWQVSGRSDTSYAERVTYDEWYILNWTFWYDIVILLQTAWIVFSGKGAV